ncbi:hypothetical protein Q7C18_00395 [Nesterenkonia sp. CL21]|uniref:hypothetical protein n=1 Tax=Nesterenkonia sp. CL21 TaxID=3064894 RepID=UPI0028793551|nr:hypothetical protein [Nesterenkonia sp. CL21]MDS2171157.1 hypothetical protein [Nesterenkonia sp. CL21]
MEGPTRRTQTVTSAVPLRRTRPALGSPHDGWATVLLTAAVALFFFGMTLARSWPPALADASWSPILAGVVLTPPLLASFHYYRRAHGSRLRRAAGLPLVALIIAAGILQLAVFPALYDSLGSIPLFGLCCLTIATVAIAPLQMVISHGAEQSTSPQPGSEAAASH